MEMSVASPLSGEPDDAYELASPMGRSTVEKRVPSAERALLLTFLNLLERNTWILARSPVARSRTGLQRFHLRALGAAHHVLRRRRRAFHRAPMIASTRRAARSK
jgi:hypothetical protein